MYVDNISVMCSILFWDVKKNIIGGRQNAMFASFIIIKDIKAIMYKSWMLYRKKMNNVADIKAQYA